MSKKIVFALTRNGIKEKCEWDVAKENKPCPRHVLHLGDNSNYDKYKLEEFEDATNEDSTSYEDYADYNYNKVVSYMVENTFSDDQLAEGVKNLAGVKAAIRANYLNYNSVPFEGLYMVYGFNENEDEVAYIKGEELISVETANANAIADQHEFRAISEMEGKFKAFKTPKCMHCGISETFNLPESAIKAYKDGALIQNAFPFLSQEKREQIKTGIHGECWIDIFGDDEDDEDDYED